MNKEDYQKVNFIFHVSEPSAEHHIQFEKLTKQSNQPLHLVCIHTCNREQCCTQKNVRINKQDKQTNNAILEGETYPL